MYELCVERTKVSFGWKHVTRYMILLTLGNKDTRFQKCIALYICVSEQKKANLTINKYDSYIIYKYAVYVVISISLFINSRTIAITAHGRYVVIF